MHLISKFNVINNGIISSSIFFSSSIFIGAKGSVTEKV